MTRGWYRFLISGEVAAALINAMLGVLYGYWWSWASAAVCASCAVYLGSQDKRWNAS